MPQAPKFHATFTLFSLEYLSKAKEVKPVVETDISRAAKGFAEDSTNIKYR